MKNDNRRQSGGSYSREIPDLTGTFCVGITGHRPNRLAGADLPLLHEKVGLALSMIRDILKDQDSSVPTVVSPLAEGADRIAAIKGLELGFSLYCPLPLPPDEYEKDFPDESSRKAFYDLLSKADFIRVLSGDAPEQAREYAYAQSGIEIIRCSSLLIALWDGQPKRGEGGTAGVVDRALSGDLPVIWIQSKADHHVRVLMPENPVTDETLRKILQSFGSD